MVDSELEQYLSLGLLSLFPFCFYSTNVLEIEINTNATKNAEYYSEALDGVAEEQTEQRHISRRKIAEVAQKASEKIGRLELELQKIQYVLLKVDEAHENRRWREAFWPRKEGLSSVNRLELAVAR